MLQCLEKQKLIKTGAINSAFVVDAPPDGNFFQLKLDAPLFEEFVWARALESSNFVVEKEDRVLIVSDDLNNTYIIGILEKGAHSHANALPKIVAEDGTAIALIHDGKAEYLEVASKSGDILFAYYPAEGKFFFQAPFSDLVLSSPFENIEMTAKKNIKLRSEGELLLTGESKVSIHTTGFGSKDSSIVLHNCHARLKAEKFSIAAGEAECNFLKIKLYSKKVSARIETAFASFESLDMVAQTIRQKTKDLYQRIDNLFQIDAGKMRMLVHRVFNLKSGRAHIKADKDIKIKGDKIHLR